MTFSKDRTKLNFLLKLGATMTYTFGIKIESWFTLSIYLSHDYKVNMLNNVVFQD